VALSAVAFVACWAGLEFGAHADTAVALGWAVLPFSTFSLLGGVWADRVRREADQAAERTGSKTPRIDQRQRAGAKARQIQIGGDLRINDNDR
jgi:hypothetical protein